MIAIVDVQYGERSARAGCVVLAGWADATTVREHTVEVDGVEPYVSGELYRRELPALLQVLAGIDAETIVVDGFVWTGPGRPGLGAHLHAARGGVVVGIAKSSLPEAPAVPVIRGDSTRPLWVSAVGVSPDDAARQVASMHGPHRLPSMVVRADHLARGLALVVGLVVTACTQNVPSHPDVYVAPRCEARVVGEVDATATAVDATDDAIYWLGYDDGTLQRRSRGDAEAEPETIVDGPDGRLADSMRVAGGSVYWTSDARHAVYRLSLGGGTPEPILETDRLLTEVEVVGGIVYAGTLDGELLWWRGPGDQGVLEVSDHEVVLAAGPDALYVASERELQRLASPGAGLQDVLTTKATITAVAVVGDRLYWKEGERVMRRVRDEVEQITTSAAYLVLAGAPGGVLIAEGNVVSFAADDRHDVVPVATTPAAITDLEVRLPSVFAGTVDGTVHELCIEPDA